MAITFHAQIAISEAFKQLIQRGRYEKPIVDLMNASTKLFPNQYKHNEIQSAGECDFLDLVTGKKYDAKLLITTQQGQWIGSRDDQILQWLNSMIEEGKEFSLKMITHPEEHDVRTLTLYKLMKDRLESDKCDEHLIFFLPFPVTNDSSIGFYRQFAADIFSAIYGALEQDHVLKEREIYIILPTTDEKIVIRNLRTGVREYFPRETVNPYIRFDF